MRPFRRPLFLRSLLLVLLLTSPAAAGPELDPALIGSWELTNKVTDAQGNPCPFVPAKMEFFPNGTAAMAGAPFGPMPAKTVLTKEERAAVDARNKDLVGKKVLLMRPSPQMSWTSSPFVYGYSVGKDVFEMIMPGWSPAKYRRVR